MTVKMSKAYQQYAKSLEYELQRLYEIAGKAREKGLDPLLESHPHRDPHNGVHWTSGSLGHGLPAAVGMALARKRMSKPGRVFVLMGDGECQEGTTWESILLAGHYIDKISHEILD